MNHEENMRLAEQGIRVVVGPPPSWIHRLLARTPSWLLWLFVVSFVLNVIASVLQVFE